MLHCHIDNFFKFIFLDNGAFARRSPAGLCRLFFLNIVIDQLLIGHIVKPSLLTCDDRQPDAFNLHNIPPDTYGLIVLY
jgi:hypothetical protein